MLLELDKRESGEDEICLLWDNVSGRTYLEVKTALDYFKQEVPGQLAGDAFAHPWIYIRTPAFPTVPTSAAFGLDS